jgi:hypothetical protein
LIREMVEAEAEIESAVDLNTEQLSACNVGGWAPQAQEKPNDEGRRGAFRRSRPTAWPRFEWRVHCRGPGGRAGKSRSHVEPPAGCHVRSSGASAQSAPHALPRSSGMQFLRVAYGMSVLQLGSAHSGRTAVASIAPQGSETRGTNASPAVIAMSRRAQDISWAHTPFT